MRGREMKIKTLVACPRQPARLYQLAWGTQKKERISRECFKSVNQSGVWARAWMAAVVIFDYAIKPNQKKQ